MKVATYPSTDDVKHGGDSLPPNTGPAPDVLPEVRKPTLAKDSPTGVSTRNALFKTAPMSTKKRINWYALRVTYGREKKAYDYLVSQHVEAFYPTITTHRIVNGKQISTQESRFHNLFFARGTEEEIKSYVYDNVNLPYLRFYYSHLHQGRRITKEPLIIPDYQMESLKRICLSEAEDIIIELGAIQKFQTGSAVRIVEGAFKGVEGRVARYHGQQRVAVLIEGLLTACTAYIPSAFMEVLEEQP